MQPGEEMDEEGINGYETYSAKVRKSGCNCACVEALAMGAIFFLLLVMLFQWHRETQGVRFV